MGPTAEELRWELAGQRDAVGRDLTAIGDRLSPGRAISRRRAAMRRSMANVRERVMGVADSATSALADTADGARAAVAEAPDALRSQTQGAPFAAGLLAFSGGFALASLLPATRTEERAAERLQPALESAAREAGHGAQDLAADLQGDVQDAAGQLADRTKEAATDAARSAKSAVESTRGGPTA
jgi:hypothetical protein